MPARDKRAKDLLELLREVYGRHRQGLYSLALSMTGSHQQAEDAVQEAFLKMAARPLPEGDAVAYVYKVVRNAAIDSRRAGARERQFTESLLNGYGQPQGEKDPSAHALDQEREQIIRDAIEQLPEAEREAIVLKGLAELTFEQAGEVSGVPAKTIATRYRRALQKLETRLRGQV